ncbi:GxxExxY protein [soil metagenome]
MTENEISGIVIGAAIDVHRRLGPGLLESVYEACMYHELRQRGLRTGRQVQMPLMYDGVRLECAYRADMVVEDTVILELKSVERLDPIHSAQLFTYLKLSGCKVGLVINFNVPLLKDGIKRVVYQFSPSWPGRPGPPIALRHSRARSHTPATAP